MSLSRRTFLGSSAVAVIAAGTMVKGKVEGANERVGVCVVGINGRGGSHIDGFTKSPDSEVVALCDVDANILKMRGDELDAATGKKVKRYSDIREALADPAIHAVSIATPNHWHALAAIWAVKAGKDVYVEKPASHEIFEGQQLVALAASTDRIIQHGTQSRSNVTLRRDIPLLQSGEIIGALHTVRALGYKTGGNRDALPEVADSEAPEGLNWRLWQGPASEKPYNKNFHPYSWHWFWHYGNGEIGNQGVHEMDIAQWTMNKGAPVKVYSAGGRYTYTDQGQTPNTNIASFTYADGTMLTFEVRNRYTNTEGGVEIDGKFLPGVGVGTLFYGSDGYYVQGQGFYDKKNKPIPIDDSKFPKPTNGVHFENFLAAVKARDKNLIHGNMNDAHTTCTFCHMANTSYRLGRSLEFDPATQRYTDDEANAYLKRAYHADFEVPQLA